jgi:two-component system response regulator PilR (NtrC family)
VQSALDLGDKRRSQQPTHNRLVGDSARMQQLRATISKLARSQAPVYIAGESGVGKELVARLIHEQGARSGGPFVPVNCGAIPAELMESELFGHRKGSFTGAHADKDGLFQSANGGTLFLDEVAELPLHLQVKLLRVIQEKSVRPVGASAEVPLDVRILSATHKNLAQLVEEGRFRHDLYYRINVIELPVPPLRERREDIAQIAAAILARLAAEMDEEKLSLSDAALAALAEHSFPGNVRELENILERAVAMSEGERIDVADLGLPDAGASPGRAQGAAGMLSGPEAGSKPSAGADGDAALPEALLQLEREKIRQALEACRYNKTRTAAHLGITFRALRYKLKKLEME